MPPSADPHVFRVLVVCTGNVCRSPLIEQMLHTTYADCSQVSFASAGTHAMVDAQMPQPAQDLAVRLGVDVALPAAHEPSQLTEWAVNRADLVLAASREHRADVVRALPRANRYTFTLREAARLLESVASNPPATLPPRDTLATPQGLRALVAAMLAERGFAAMPDDPADDDIVDPYLRSPAFYDRSGAQVSEALARAQQALSTLLPAELALRQP